MALKDITLGQYFPGQSIVHRLDPRTKLICVVCYIVALFLAQWWVTYALMFLVLAGTVKLSTISPKAILRGMKPVVFLLVFTAILNALYYPGSMSSPPSGSLKSPGRASFTPFLWWCVSCCWCPAPSC